MTVNSLPSAQSLRKILRYEFCTGKLFWNHRDPSLFSAKVFTLERAAAMWNGKFAGKEAFTATDEKGRLSGRIFNKGYRAHRVIWKMIYGVDPIEIDHKDGDSSNNRFSNIRDVSHQENMKNRKIPQHNTSGEIGISWDKWSNKWVVRISHNKRSRNLGRFIYIEDAVRARDKALSEFGYFINHGRS